MQYKLKKLKVYPHAWKFHQVDDDTSGEEGLIYICRSFTNSTKYPLQKTKNAPGYNHQSRERRRQRIMQHHMLTLQHHLQQHLKEHFIVLQIPITVTLWKVSATYSLKKINEYRGVYQSQCTYRVWNSHATMMQPCGHTTMNTCTPKSKYVTLRVPVRSLPLASLPPLFPKRQRCYRLQRAIWISLWLVRPI